MPPVMVEVAPVETQVVKDQFRALGSLESEELVLIVSELNAVVKRIPFEEGQPVAQGALLAQLDDREIKAEAMRAEAQAELAKANSERSKKLAEQNAISEQEKDDAIASLKVAEANADLAKARLEKTQIRAPFPGLIGPRRVSPGAYLKSGDPIAEMARVDQMKVTFSLPERYLGSVHREDLVRVTTPAYPGQWFSGRVSVVSPIVNPESRNFTLVAKLPNPHHLLRPGMSADVFITFGERTGALVVPDEAVFAEGTQSYVYVVKPDSTVSRTAIDIGSRDSMRVEVVRGLAAGAVVVRAGHQKLFEGAHVIPLADTTGASAAPTPPEPAAGATTRNRVAKNER